ncbi:hypothetical protein ACFL5I_01295 [Planctomycetota bacterium]
MKRTLPLVIVFVLGIIMIFQAYIPHPVSESLMQKANIWFIAMMGFALILAVGSFINLHITKIKRNTSDWPYSLVALSSMLVMASIGIFGGIGTGSLFMHLFFNVQVPMAATMFSLLAFFMASAAYRAFRARTFEATLLLVAAIIVMLGRVPIGDFLTAGYASEIVEFLFTGPNMAAKRAILLGVSLGAIAMSLKIIFGIERAWLGGGE